MRRLINKTKINESNLETFGQEKINFANKYGIKYHIIDDRWSKSRQLVEYIGNINDFFQQQKKSNFIQVTKPVGLNVDNDNLAYPINIGIMIPSSKKGSAIGVTYKIISNQF